MKRALLELADEVRAIATTGLHFTDGAYDRERYAKLLDLSVRIAALTEVKSEDELRAVYAASDEGYVTPKLDARMAVFRGASVLLVQERVDGDWALPGGYVDIGDSPAGAAERETFEEAGIEVRTLRLAGVFDYRLQPQAPPCLFHIHKLVFVGEPLGGADPTPGAEVLDARFFALDALPPLSLGRTLPLHIEVARRLADDPGRPTHFD